MITVDEALTRVFALCQPLGTEHVPLAQAAGRVLAEPARALRDQNPEGMAFDQLVENLLAGFVEMGGHVHRCVSI